MSSISATRAVVLTRTPQRSGPAHEDFGIEEIALAPLGPGQLLLRNEFMSVDPSMRGRLEPTVPLEPAGVRRRPRQLVGVLP